MPRKSELDRDALTDLEQIPNIGPRIAEELGHVGITAPKQLRGKDPYALYEKLCEQQAQRYDPCVLDVFIAVTEFMNGKQGRPWWKYTAQRKRELAKRERTGASKRIGRRAMLIGGALTLIAAKNRRACLADSKLLTPREELRFSVLTDMHYADKPPGGTRHYRATLGKLANASRQIEQFKPQFVVELGDVIDAAESVEQEKRYLQTIHKQLAALPGENHYVLGNHCVYWLTKAEFLAVVDQPRSYYSFDVSGYHFIVLDACFRSNGEPYGRKNFQWTDANLPKEELEWLEADLKGTTAPTVVFIHQRLDVDDHYGVKNAAAVRQLLEKSGNVEFVMQGHNHKNDCKEIGDIVYVTFTALVEGSGPEDNAYANVRVDKQGNFHIAGFHRQQSYEWTD